jgi:protein-S-isoprenylcysteine O-methyltransferase Ste14
MNTYNRLFGSGPVGLAISIALLFPARYFKNAFNIPDIFIGQKLLRWTIFIALSVAAIMIFIASNKALGIKTRGKTLITTGIFKYFRHPLYAAFLTFFDFGLAILLNNWVLIAWAMLLHPIWHIVVSGEESMMKEAFPGEYEAYCRHTGRFFPRIEMIKNRENYQK